MFPAHNNFNLRMSTMGNIEFAEWLEEQVAERGWSFRELARRSDMAASTISKVASRSLLPSCEFCIAISRPLGLSAEQVLRIAGILPVLPSPVTEEREALAIFRSLPGNLRVVALNILRSLVHSDILRTIGMGEEQPLSGDSTYEDYPGSIPRLTEREMEILKTYRESSQEWQSFWDEELRRIQTIQSLVKGGEGEREE